ncbi:DgyrCDS2943 [Dimorphilus gyrociliatus]|uniref:DgyrCDS2943 n=1 Tax=Dimorphilus gyrociliatus TaxID=2664684 RepID=A0A7I8VBQ3_9ANNE|nr:DgyrCDS2943 [Dimorphilus gyrociliatus]
MANKWNYPVIADILEERRKWEVRIKSSCSVPKKFPLHKPFQRPPKPEPLKVQPMQDTNIYTAFRIKPIKTRNKSISAPCSTPPSRPISGRTRYYGPPVLEQVPTINSTISVSIKRRTNSPVNKIKRVQSAVTQRRDDEKDFKREKVVELAKRRAVSAPPRRQKLEESLQDQLLKMYEQFNYEKKANGINGLFVRKMTLHDRL